jgi:uncharacterized protein (UPF0332 family)
MSAPIRPEWLIRQAYELGGFGAGAGRPRSIDLRRAASSAYYAVFHATLLALAWWLLPDATDDERHALVRRFNHAGIKKAFERVKTPLGPIDRTALDPVYRKLAANQEIIELAETFVDLQEARHMADYDHFATFTRLEVLLQIRRAEAAMATLTSLPTDHPVDSNRLFACLSMSTASNR